MGGRVLACIAAVMVLSVAGAGRASAWGWCDCEDKGYYEPDPVYIYDYSKGPRWTPNGFSYPPVGVYYPEPAPYPVYRGPREPDVRVRYHAHHPSWQPRRGMKDW
jgi:hypothetical protein